MSRFVSAGTDADARPPVDDGWLEAQKAVEATKKTKSAEPGQQDGGKSLYEVLQANKTAKQDAFEEAARLKNQFRALDEDEVDFLESVLETSRAKEDAVKQETAEQLEVFRQQRLAAERASVETPDLGNATTSVDSSLWATKKKRRRDKETELVHPLKLRKMSSTDGDKPKEDRSPVAPPKSQPSAIAADQKPVQAASTVKAPVKATGLGLADYSSDDED